ncbi:hypothetical protein F441_07614, partial [Phytophthora nicotianae CJ01A1]
MCVPKDTAGAENELDAVATTDTRSVGSTEGSACAIRDFESYCSGEAASLNTKCSLFVVKYTARLEKKLNPGVTPDVTICGSKCFVSLEQQAALSVETRGLSGHTRDELVLYAPR